LEAFSLGKERIYKVARKLKISTTALMSILSDLGIPAKSHMNFILAEDIDKVKNLFEQQKEMVRKREEKRKKYSSKLKKRYKEVKAQEQVSKPEMPSKKPYKKRIITEKEKKYGRYRPRYWRKAREEKGKEKVEIKPEIRLKPKKVLPAASVEKLPQKKKQRRTKPIAISKKDRRAEEQEKKFYSEEQIRRSIRITLSKDKKKKYKKVKEEVKRESKIVISEFTSVRELAKIMNIESVEIVGKFLEWGKMVTINQRLDKESLIMICDEFNFDVEFADQYGSDIIEGLKQEVSEDQLVIRPPVVTIMGHVDHGKTSLLDYIKKTNVVAGEVGKITQHIGAYNVKYKGKSITFIDTPGHAAFTAMRARGANITDIAVILIAADDGVMPQTIEAIDHARNADVPIIIAISKIDLPEADSEKVKKQLANINVRLQGWGGKIEYVECSAKTGQGVDKLLDLISLTAELEEFKANPQGKGEGTVIEAELDEGKGPLVTILLRDGKVEIGDIVVCGPFEGTVRSMYDERGNPIKYCGPSGVVRLVGLSGVPQAGDTFNVVEDKKTAREISSKRHQIFRERQIMHEGTVTLDNLFDKIKQGNISHLNVIIKADMDGSVEAVADVLQKISTPQIPINIVHRGVGGITETDVNLAIASSSIIIGFHIRPNNNAKQLAKKNNIDIKLYEIIYNIENDIKKSVDGMIAPIMREKVLGTAEVRQIFKIPKVGVIAGSNVLEGKISRNSKIKLYRNNVKIYEGNVISLKRLSDDVNEVKQGFDCGIRIENFNDIKVSDIIEAYEIVEENTKTG